MEESQYWADQTARRIIKERNRDIYTFAAGITPSGTIHIGNFREPITVDLVKRALESLGKKVRFIYSWDDYDRLRKIPKNMPKQNLLKKFLGFPVSKVPDPFECHLSYAEHNEQEFELALQKVNVKPTFIRQTKKYRANAYKDGIKTALEHRNKIKEILNKYRKEPLDNYWPIEIYCNSCNMDFTKPISWENYTIKYHCKTCDKDFETDFSKDGNVKLRWRVDWPMRWNHEKVDFEPAGKEHSTPGGSRTTAVEIAKEVYNIEPPTYQMYDFVIVKGKGGKMSSSTGNVLSLQDVLKIYIPEIVRYYFASTKPNKEFSIATDEEVIKTYEDFFKTERVFYGQEPTSERDKKHLSRVYEMSALDKPANELPIQPGFRHCIELINIHKTPERALEKVIELEKITKESDKKRYLNILKCSKKWLEIYAPDKYKFEIQTKLPEGLNLSTEQKHVLLELSKNLKARDWTESELSNEFRTLCQAHKLSYNDFFKAAYLVLLNKEKGPRLAPFILAIGKDIVADLYGRVR